MRPTPTVKKHQQVIGLFRGFPRIRPMYRGIVRVFEKALADGALPTTQKLPPERALAQALRVSRTTVVTAYRELESKGLVRGFVGRGTFVSAQPDVASAPFAWRGKVSAAALQSTDSTVRDLVRAAGDPKVMSFAAGLPALESPRSTRPTKWRYIGRSRGTSPGATPRAEKKPLTDWFFSGTCLA